MIVRLLASRNAGRVFIMSREELIKHYERNLEKVKAMHNPDKYDSDLRKDQCNSYIEFAEKELEEVKGGREW
jgi:hypothetical protein